MGLNSDYLEELHYICNSLFYSIQQWIFFKIASFILAKYLIYSISSWNG
jgi:hypothetical protein